jgi:ferredoxin
VNGVTSILIDTYLCNACGTCVAVCPEIYRISEITGKAETVPEVPAISEAVYRAAAFCPEQCIAIRET